MVIKRDVYLNRLIDARDNDMIKVVTGIRRSGKSYLVFRLFYDYLIKSGVNRENILTYNFDDLGNYHIQDAFMLYDDIKSKIQNDRHYYVLLDEVQFLIKKEDVKSGRPLPVYGVLSGLLNTGKVDVYITGSNSKFLSSDVMTEFRGRGMEIHIQPLSFSEYLEASGESFENAWRNYMYYGGLPQLFNLKSDLSKTNYLSGVFSEIYMKDIKERYGTRNAAGMDDLLNVLASSIGSLVSSKKISDTMKSSVYSSMSIPTIDDYLEYLQDSFMIEKTQRFNVKGRKYIGSPCKYYFTDPGLRNARLGFRQIEETHLMENVIYNELRFRGYEIDIGMVSINEKQDNYYVKKNLEVDFVARKGIKLCYIQSALNLKTREKTEQEQKSLININDSFKKIIITSDNIHPYYTDRGILIISIKDFFQNPAMIE